MRWRRMLWWFLGAALVVLAVGVGFVGRQRGGKFIDLSGLHLVSDKVEDRLGKRWREMSFADSDRDVINKLNYDGNPEPGFCDLGMCGSDEFVLSDGRSARMMNYMGSADPSGVKAVLWIDLAGPRKPFHPSWWDRLRRRFGL